MMPINEEKDIIFKETDDGPLKADVYYPTEGDKYPGIVLIHGGAWLQGYKEMYCEWGPYLAQQGYVTMTFNYRLSTPETPTYPDVINDVKDAVQFFVKNSKKWKIDTDNIVILGDSAGGHLATYITIDSQKDPSYHITAVIGVYGVYDLPAWQQYTMEARDNDPVGQLMGGSCNEMPEKYKEASPYYKIKMLEKPFNTIFFIIWGDSDDVVPASQSEAFSLLLEQKGFDTQTLVIPNKGHYWFNIFEGIEGGSLKDDPNSLVVPNILNYLKMKLSK
ncbi:alpha/beta hydrolase fold domain-containing protein [Scopulibacillus cellulosilyticus]|uniref:Alpha/beta hydrolase fold domain-containing protein n=1 Tax=Scopulibacillus cellulosilyticus TaxID=2665665 RepID=A0ABW2Q2I2_9BACL